LEVKHLIITTDQDVPCDNGLPFKSHLIDDRTRVHPKVSGLAAWSENCKRYSYLPLGAVVSLSCETA